MQLNPIDHTGDNRLRFVFNETVVLLNFSTDVTLAEIAQKLSAFPTRRFGKPIAIDVIIGSREGKLASPNMRWTPPGQNAAAPHPAGSA